MVAVCNQCPSVTQGIVWYKFPNDTVWRYYKPAVFPFSYVYDPIGGGQYKLKFLKPEPGAQATYPLFSFDEVNSRGSYLGTFNASAAQTPFFYGDLSTFTFAPDSTNRFWQVRGLDACGNYFAKTLYKGTTGVTTTPLGVYGGAPYSGSRALTSSITPVSPRYINNQFANCPACPHFWDSLMKEFTGIGIPQISITCGKDACPPNTACECDCTPTDICCHDANGIPLYIAQK